MTNLSCNVTECQTNCNGNCCYHSISVGGAMATSCDGTCCKSFVPKSGAQNSSCNCEPNYVQDICCDACDCQYNMDKKCKANQICIKPCSSGTECSSFVRK